MIVSSWKIFVSQGVRMHLHKHLKRCHASLRKQEANRMIELPSPGSRPVHRKFNYLSSPATVRGKQSEISGKIGNVSQTDNRGKGKSHYTAVAPRLKRAGQRRCYHFTLGH